MVAVSSSKNLVLFPVLHDIKLNISDLGSVG